MRNFGLAGNVFGWQNPLATGKKIGSFNLLVPGCSIYETAAQALPTNGAETAVTFSFEYFDHGELHSTTTNTSRITFVVPGVYFFLGRFFWDANATGTFREARILLNGNNAIDDQALVPSSVFSLSQQTSALYRVSAGDYAELTAQHDGGAGRSVASPVSPARFSALWVSS